MRLATLSRLPIAVLVVTLAVTAASGCGSGSGSSSSSESQPAPPTVRTSTAPAGASARSCGGAVGAEDLRVTGVSCGAGRGVVAGWRGKSACSTPGASRLSCAVGGYRCLGAATDRGVAVSCARPGRSLSFVAGRG